ncbi:ABC transporter permease [Acetivibrio mesophilus]|uniref:ABC transporter permease n=1 Tax=Acetivibrio mesophilus TaxID=2487273 RepID=A0A4Q0I834_9FIRM|nr:FtsX-like permease family protein [Acetivibrio mesophilus]RXE60596.1 ABC transporter permease [Acetivibrio mesophilus]
MKHYLDLVPISEKVHRKQNRMSIFCIVLAVSLVTTIFGMADMFIRSQILQTQLDDGNFHIAILDITDEDAALIAKRTDIKAAARYGVLNYRGEKGYTIFGKDSIIVGCDKAWVTELLVDNITEGNFPQIDTQAMITESAKDRFGLQLGDSITIDGPDGKKLQYTLSGFCRNASKTMSEDSYGIILTTDAFRALYPNKNSNRLTDYNSMLFVRFENAWNARQEINDLKTDYGFSEEQIVENSKLLGLLGQSGSSFMLQIYATAGVLFVLVMVAGIMMIASSLNSNVAWRTRFFGLMRCIGATPKQVMRIVRKEALRWCWFAIPAGIAIGVVVIWTLCAVLRTVSPEYFGEMAIFGLSIPSIFAGIIVGLFTVLLAARSPAKKAAKVSPLEAVSGNASDYQPVKKAANTKLFKVETALGIHHAKASKKNLILMVGSFALSIILFLSFSVTVEFMNHALTPLRPWKADLSIISPDYSCSIGSELLEKLKENPAVKSVYGRMFAYDVPVTVNGSQEKMDLISYEQHQFDWAKDYLLEGSIDDVIKNPNTALIVFEPENTLRVGDTVTMTISNRLQEIHIVGMLSTSPFKNGNDVGIMISSEATFRQITGESDYTILDIQLKKKATDEDVSAIKQMAGVSNTFSDERMSKNSVMATYYCFWLFIYGFLVMIALITVLNVINSIAMSVYARTNQYGAFRAIGLSMRQLNKMVISEACTYTIIGSFVGTVLGLFCNKTLFYMIVSSKWGTSWTIPWTELGIILLVVVLSVALAVQKPMKKFKEISIVDTINMQ